MRADRLLALMLLLQNRGRLTARELARELHVSERTIYRDVEALSIAGIPVFTELGRHGGIGLVEQYRTRLTGLTLSEVQALFAAVIPEPLRQMGLADDARDALLKIGAALPTRFGGESERIRRRIYLDAGGDRVDSPVPHLRALHDAVLVDLTIDLVYRQRRGPRGEMQVRRAVDPFGIVTRAGAWYLVASRSGRVDVYPVAKVLRVDVHSERFDRPDWFDLAEFWAEWCAANEHRKSQYPVTLRISREALPLLQSRFGREMAEVPADWTDRVTLTLPFERLEAARTFILGLGGAAEVLEPEALRRSIADFAIQVLRRYSAGAAGG